MATRMRYSKQLVCATAAILLFGLASVSASLADQKPPDGDPNKGHDKAHPQRQQPQRQQPQQQHPQQQHPQFQPQGPTPLQRPGTPGRNLSPTPSRGGRPNPPQQGSVGGRVEQQQVWPRYRAQHWRSQHRTWGQRGGYNGYRIPGPQFGIYFGRPHRFHLSSFELRIYGGYPQFCADGYWFTLLDPVPEYWREDWYRVDYVTIVASRDGYYLLNAAYPDEMLAVSVQAR